MQCQSVSFLGKDSVLEFKLSPKTCKAVSEHTKLSINEIRTLSPEYSRYLMIKRGSIKPSEQYLIERQVITKEEIDKQIDELLKEPLHIRITNCLENKFNKN